jgi:hypothetical protein
MTIDELDQVITNARQAGLPKVIRMHPTDVAKLTSQIVSSPYVGWIGHGPVPYATISHYRGVPIRVDDSLDEGVAELEWSK